MASFATSDDVEERWRTLSDDELTIADNLLAYASAVVRQAVTDADDRIADATLDVVLVKNIVVSMVLRVMQNPDGVLEEEEAIDDYRTRRRRDSAVSTGEMYISDSELKLLQRRRSGSFSITPYRAETTFEDYAAVAAVRAQREDWP